MNEVRGLVLRRAKRPANAGRAEDKVVLVSIGRRAGNLINAVAIHAINKIAAQSNITRPMPPGPSTATNRLSMTLRTAPTQKT